MTSLAGEKAMSVHSRNVDNMDHQEFDAPEHESASPSRRDERNHSDVEVQDEQFTTKDFEPEERPSLESRRRRHTRRAYGESISSIYEATDSQLLKRMILAIEGSEWRPETILGLLKKSVHRPSTVAAAEATTPETSKRLGQDSWARILDPGPRLADYEYTAEQRDSLWDLKNCARSTFRPTSGSRAPVFVVIGLFEGPDMAPNERILYIKHHDWVFWCLL